MERVLASDTTDRSSSGGATVRRKWRQGTTMSVLAGADEWYGSSWYCCCSGPTGPVGLVAACSNNQSVVGLGWYFHRSQGHETAAKAFHISNSAGFRTLILWHECWDCCVKRHRRDGRAVAPLGPPKENRPRCGRCEGNIHEEASHG